MKRKLDEDNVPIATDTQNPPNTHDTPDFETLDLDPRLLQAVRNEGFSRPTAVQSRVIPLMLNGKDVLGKINHYCTEASSYRVSACKNWFWQDACVRTARSGNDPEEESGKHI